MPSAPRTAEGGVWRARPLLAVAVTAVAVLIPVLGTGAGIVIASELTRGASTPVRVSAAVTGAVALSVLAALASVRLLTLSALLRLSLVFPDRLPGRFRTALRAGTPTRALRSAGPGSAGERIVDLAATIATHDRATRGHSERVRAYTEVIARRMDVSETDLDRLRWAALLHDVGKVSVPGDVLRHSGALREHEWELMRHHPAHGDELIEPIRDHLGPWADTVLHHHERFDGTGYPAGLSADAICLGARIVSVADAFEVMTGSARRYRRSASLTEARAELVRCAGTQFDPEVVRAFVTLPLDVLGRVMRAATLGLPVPMALAATAGTGGFEHALPVGARLTGRLPDGAHAGDEPAPELDDVGALDER